MPLSEFAKDNLKRHLHHQSAVVDDDGSPIQPGGGEAGVEGGYAPLDSGLLVPLSYLPTAEGGLATRAYADAVAAAAGVWQTVAAIEDTDTDSAFDVDTGMIDPVREFYRIYYSIEEHSGVANNLMMRINNINASYYHLRDDNTNDDNQTQWTLIYGISANRAGFGEASLRGGVASAPTHTQVAGVHSAQPGTTAASTIVTRRLGTGTSFGGGNEISRIRLWTAGDATGRILILGSNVPF